MDIVFCDVNTSKNLIILVTTGILTVAGDMTTQE